MCGCGKGGNNNFRQQQQRTRANLQSPRRSFIPPGTPPALNMPASPQQQNFMLGQSALPGVPDNPAERRRIQRLHQEAIRKRFNK